MREIGFTEVGGIRVGHAQNEEAATGCTVVLFDELAPAGVDVRGGGPASRETPLLNPTMAAAGLHALLLSGGSAYGLDAAGGVMAWLEKQGVGFAVGPARVPLVCESCLFDLGIGRWDVRPDAAMAVAACEAATRENPAMGNVGAGCGCTVGKLGGGGTAMKTGLGWYAVELGGLKIGALVAVNAVGDVCDPETGRILAGMLTPDKTAFADTRRALWAMAEQGMPPAGQEKANTTLGVIVTNAGLQKSALCKVAGMAHNGYARAIRPVHTMMDGDTVYAVSTGNVPADIDLVGTLAAHVMAKAIVRAAQSAKGSHGLPAACDLAF